MNDDRTKADKAWEARQEAAAFELPGGGLMVDSQRVRQLGDIRVTALDDGFHDLPITVVVNIDEAGAAALAELSSGKDLLRPVFNAYLVETGGRQLLIDAGAGGHLGPTSGKMLENLAQAGVAPDDIGAIIITHCHPDHILGIVDENWNAVFPNCRAGGAGTRRTVLAAQRSFKDRQRVPAVGGGRSAKGCCSL
jgi:Metallo-beta-lactamase superfamily